jgi:SPP1 gp7 family putative phage head morphogenesis protein
MTDIYRMIERFRREQLARERAASTAMVKSYGTIWRELNRQIRDTVRRYYDLLSMGQEGDALLWRMDRLTALRAQVEQELIKYASYAETTVRVQQQEAITAGIEHGWQLMGAAGEGLGLEFNRMPTEALANLIGFTQDGTPLAQVMRGYAGEGAGLVSDALVQGMALGYNPRRTANLVRRALGGNLANWLRLARTETLRAYREANHQVYLQNSDVLEGWIWVSARNTRTCACCWAMDGTFHELDERLDDHPNGRCTAAPKVRGVDFPQRVNGVQAFGMQAEEDQYRVLGPAKYTAYKNGDIVLPDLVGVKHDRIWGRMFYERSLKELGMDWREIMSEAVKP